MKFWAGFCDGKLSVRKVDSGFAGWGNSFTDQPALFRFKPEAEREYEDVRQVEIREVQSR